MSTRIVVALSLALTATLHAGPASPPTPAILLEGTVVTMNAEREVLENGRVLVRAGRIAAVWQGAKPPEGVTLDGVVRPELGPHAIIFPGLINLHDHPFFDALPLWQTPASHVQAAFGRPTGAEPYANRGQWRGGSPEALRLVNNPATILDGFLLSDVIKYGKVRMILGGTTTTDGGGSSPLYDTLLARNAESPNFGRQRIANRVDSIGLMPPGDAEALAAAMQAGELDAWLVHLGEGVRDGDRRPGDPVSSRAEFADLKAKHLLTGATVIVHGVALEQPDFEEMAQAGAKLVWSPLSNMLLYGKTTSIYEALAVGVPVSLGTDWTPSGSPNLLTELKVADRALRDRRVLAAQRHLVPGLSGNSGEADRALDRLLVEMVTINPAAAIRWDDQVGSIEAGKAADLLVISTPGAPAPRSSTPGAPAPRSSTSGAPAPRSVTPPASREAGVPESPYRRLIDATERDVQLVVVGGVPLAGDTGVIAQLKPGDFEVVHSAAGCFDKAIDVTDAAVPGGSETLAQISGTIGFAMQAFGGDHPPAGGGPSSAFANTWSVLKANFPGGPSLTDLQFNLFVLVNFFGLPGAIVNLEAIAPPPLFTVDDDWWLATLAARRDPVSGLTDDATPPYGRYLANANQVTALGNPFAIEQFQERWYSRGCGVR